MQFKTVDKTCVLDAIDQLKNENANSNSNFFSFSNIFTACLLKIYLLIVIKHKEEVKNYKGNVRECCLGH